MPPVKWMEMLQDLGFVNGHASVDGGHNFLFTAQKPASFGQSAIPDDISRINPSHVVKYSIGNEMQLRTRLSDMAPRNHLQLYVVVLEGRDADSAKGLCATLALEFPFWGVHLAIFKCAIQLSEPLQVLAKYRDLFEHGERVVYFPGEGSPCVLRAVPSTAPPVITDRSSLALGDLDHLVVDIISSQATTAVVHGFVGRVVTCPRQSPPPGALVAGITDQRRASTLVVHHSCLVPLNPHRPLPEPGDVLKSVVTTLLHDCLSEGLQAQHSRLVAVEDQTMSNILTTHFKADTLVQCDFENDDPSRSVDMLITDSRTSSLYPHLRHWVPRSGRFILWDVFISETLRDNTWQIERALKFNASELVGANTLPRQPVAQVSPVSLNEVSFLPLFRHDKSYILLGGIGGLGIDLAVWMYQHGARHIVLTSRRGIASLDSERDVEAVSKIAYLRSCDQLELQLVKCDATDTGATSRLVESIRLPIGGCFQLTLVLSDRLFLNQTRETFAAPQTAKLTVFETFAAVAEIENLDFYVAFSSFSGLVGYVGQSNYASACTVLEGVLSRYSNAFSLVVPGIQDAGYLDRADFGEAENKGIILASMSAAELWICLEDGLRKLRDGQSFTRYIPDLDWDSWHARYPLSPTFRHLLSSAQQKIESKVEDLMGEEDILRIVLSAMEVEEQDFDSERPLLSYGLDSLSATRLSAELNPFVQVSQIQLLAGVSWSELRDSLLQTQKAEPDPEVVEFDHPTARKTVTTVLGVNEGDFDENVPLVSYGLDSISASKVAVLLRPHFPEVTQLQLMGNTTWATLATSIRQTAAAVQLRPTDHDNSTVLAAETIVEICIGPGLPLIVFPGATGRLGPLLALRTHFSGALWGVQVTESTPVAPFMTHAAFVVQKIREKQPNGPYRLGAFSGAGVLGVAVAKLLEESGQEVIQLAFIDGFPLLWTEEETELFLREQELPALLNRAIISIIDLLRHDPIYGPDSEQILQWEAALAGTPDATETHLATIAATRRLAPPLLRFLLGFYPTSAQRSYAAFADALACWVSSLKAPFSVFIAEFGMLATMPDVSRRVWADLGAHRYHGPKKVEQHFIAGVGHYGILADKSTAALLQRY